MNVWIIEDERFAETVAPGSAVVSVATSGETVCCHIEGNLYGAANIRTWADRANHAASRLRTGYPTTGVRALPRAAVLRVGHFDEERGLIVLDPEATEHVLAWLGCRPDDLAAELLTTEGSHQLATRALEQMQSTPMGRMQAAWLRKHGPLPYRS